MRVGGTNASIKYESDDIKSGGSVCRLECVVRCRAQKAGMAGKKSREVSHILRLFTPPHHSRCDDINLCTSANRQNREIAEPGNAETIEPGSAAANNRKHLPGCAPDIGDRLPGERTAVVVR